MRFALFVCTFWYLSSAAAPCVKPPSALYLLLKKHASPKSVPLQILEPEIKRLSDKYAVPNLLIAQVLLVESRGLRSAVNHKTHDYGLMQLHRSTVGLTTTQLHSWMYNLETGVRMLSTIKRICRYNVGTGALTGKKLSACLNYEAKLKEMKQ